MSPIDLASLADVKAWLGLASSGDDALLAGLITDVSTAILSDLGRAAILPTVFAEMRNGLGEAAITLRQWPVGQVLSLAMDGLPIALATGAAPSAGPAFAAVLEPADPAPPGTMQRLSLRGGRMSCGIGNVAVSYRAGYEIAAEAARVPLTAPFVVTALAPFGRWASDGAVTYAGGSALKVGAVPALGVYAVAGGAYTFAPADAGAAVTLRYGYLPADLARACCEWVADRYAARSRIGQSSKTLGGQETTAFIVKAMPDFVSRLLQPYRRVAAP